MSESLNAQKGARRRAVISSVSGNALEFYDTTVYAFFTIYFAGHFFPAEDALTSQIYAYFVFGISYLVRPLGGILLSVYADRIGRKPLIVLLMVVMALTTGCIGLLPTYAQIGMAAPILLIAIRLLQAVAVGGLFSSTTAFLMEFAPADRRGFYASMQMMAQALSPILANLVALSLLYLVGRDAVIDVWWRLPFLLGFLTLPLGYYIHKHVNESPDFTQYVVQAARRKTSSAPQPLSMSQTLKQWTLVRQIVCCVGIITVGTVSFFGVNIYLPGYVQTLLGLADTQRTWLALTAPACAAVSVLIGGGLSDRIGRKNMLQLGIVLYALAFFGLFFYFSGGNASYGFALFGFAVLGFCMGLHWGAVPILLAESFPIHVRATAIAIPYNLTVVLFGALTPTYLKLFERMFGNTPYNVLLYIGASIVISLVASTFWRPADKLALKTTL
jgi:MHS family proline/betaine transporter-like MFS transporter